MAVLAEVVVAASATTTFFYPKFRLGDSEKQKNCRYFWGVKPWKKIEMENSLNWDEFTKVEMAVGTIVSAEVFKEARKPAYRMQIDFGPLGLKKTSAQITDRYRAEDLPGRQVIAVVNFPPKQIANLMSECLVLGSVGPNGEVILLQPERGVENGSRIG